MELVKVAQVSEIPAGGFKVVSLLGKRVGVFREADGSIRAIEVTCKHQGADLTLGKREGDVLVCPRHGWRYHARTGRCLQGEGPPLRRFPVKEEGEDLLIGLPGGPSTEDEPPPPWES